MEKEIICQECPNRCRLLVNGTPEQVTVAGNRCPRGERFGKAEFLGDKKVVSGSVKTTVEGCPKAMVETDRPVPKGMVYKVVLALKRITVTQPMAKGSIVAENICSTGANVVLTQDVAI